MKIIIGILLVMLIGLVIESGINKGEIVECNKWQEHAAMYEGFYLVQWQKDQCDAHQITINAPVK